VAFSPDGHILVTFSDDDTVRLWDVNNPHHPTLLYNLTGHSISVDSVVFSSNGNTLATGNGDHTVRLWDISDPHQPRPLGTLTGLTGAIPSVSFSPNGHTLATASSYQVRLWETNVERVSARICRITSSITNDEWNEYLPGLPYRPPCLRHTVGN
jgi:WD40 repeat protein